MGFCTDEEYAEFLRSCPEFERMLVRSGIMLIKYWFSVSDEEQEKRFQARIARPDASRWKLSPMDLERASTWVEYSRAKDEMFNHTDIKQAPWYVVPGGRQAPRAAELHRAPPAHDPLRGRRRRRRSSCRRRQPDTSYVRPPMDDQTFVPAVF